MSLLIAPDDVTLYPAGAEDAHGWAEEGATAVWSGRGCLQPGPGFGSPLASEGGGHGPFDPRAGGLAVLFLPPEAPVVEGIVALVEGRRYALSQTRQVGDPLGTGDLDCWVATATTVDSWAA